MELKAAHAVHCGLGYIHLGEVNFHEGNYFLMLLISMKEQNLCFLSVIIALETYVVYDKQRCRTERRLSSKFF